MFIVYFDWEYRQVFLYESVSPTNNLFVNLSHPFISVAIFLASEQNELFHCFSLYTKQGKCLYVQRLPSFLFQWSIYCRVLNAFLIGSSCTVGCCVLLASFVISHLLMPLPWIKGWNGTIKPAPELMVAEIKLYISSSLQKIEVLFR